MMALILLIVLTGSEGGWIMISLHGGVLGLCKLVGSDNDTFSSCLKSFEVSGIERPD